jgi:hypothetical protein
MFPSRDGEARLMARGTKHLVPSLRSDVATWQRAHSGIKLEVRARPVSESLASTFVFCQCPAQEPQSHASTRGAMSLPLEWERYQRQKSRRAGGGKSTHAAVIKQRTFAAPAACRGSTSAAAEITTDRLTTGRTACVGSCCQPLTRKPTCRPRRDGGRARSGFTARRFELTLAFSH